MPLVVYLNRFKVIKSKKEKFARLEFRGKMFSLIFYCFFSLCFVSLRFCINCNNFYLFFFEFYSVYLFFLFGCSQDFFFSILFSLIPLKIIFSNNFPLFLRFEIYCLCPLIYTSFICDTSFAKNLTEFPFSLRAFCTKK